LDRLCRARARVRRAGTAAPVPPGTGPASACLNRRRPGRHGDPFRQDRQMNTISRVTVALLATVAAAPAIAQEFPADEAITVQSPLLHPAAGLMNEHMHEGGEAMIGLRFERVRYGGGNVSGDDPIADP